MILTYREKMVVFCKKKRYFFVHGENKYNERDTVGGMGGCTMRGILCGGWEVVCVALRL